MARYTAKAWIGKVLFVGIDLHQTYWQVTILSEEGLRVFAGRIASNWEALSVLLDRYQQARQIVVAYEAGYFGFWLPACPACGRQAVGMGRCVEGVWGTGGRDAACLPCLRQAGGRHGLR